MTDLEYVKKMEELENREKNVAAKQAKNEKEKEVDRISEQIRNGLRQGL